jgi:hypothetical protein
MTLVDRVYFCVLEDVRYLACQEACIHQMSQS